MLATIILLTLAVIAEFIVIIVFIPDFYEDHKKLDKFFNYNPYANYRSIMAEREDYSPYDDTPAFIKGIKNMVKELERPSYSNANYIQKKIEDTECRIDNLADDFFGHDNRLDNYDSDIKTIRSSVEELDSELTRRVDNLEKFCYGTKEADNATEGS